MLEFANLMGAGVKLHQYVRVSYYPHVTMAMVLSLISFVLYFLLVVDCFNLTAPSNGQVSLTTTTFGSVVMYTCKEGYLVMGSAMRECLANGSWSQQEPVCQSKLLYSDHFGMCNIFPSLSVVDCGTLSNPSNGSVMFSMSTFGAMARYMCDEGLNPIGSSTRLCQADGSWEGVAPTCQSEWCVLIAMKIQWKLVGGEAKKYFYMWNEYYQCSTQQIYSKLYSTCYLY